MAGRHDRSIAGERGWLFGPPDMGRRLVAETLGTALLVVFGAGSVVTALLPR